MIAGIVAFVAVATTVAFGSPCGNSGKVGFIRSSPIVSSFGSGFSTPVVGSSRGSSVIATPSFVSSSFSPVLSSIGDSISAPITTGINSVVGAGAEVVATEVAAPSYSAFVSPVSSGTLSSGICGGAPASVISAPVASLAMSSGTASPFLGSSSPFSSAFSSSVVVPSHRPSVGSFFVPVINSPAVSTVVSAPVVEPVSVASPIVSSLASPIVSSGVLGCGGLLTGTGCGC